MSPPHPLAPWMVQGTSPAPPCPSLGRRGGQQVSPPPRSLATPASRAGSEDWAGAWLNLLPARPHQAQLLHKKNGAPAPGVVGEREGTEIWL